MVIRKATVKDIFLLEEINFVAEKEQGWRIPQSSQFYNKFIKNKNNAIYLALKDKRLLGFLALEYNNDRKSTWINDVYVLPEARKRGFAKKLVQMALNDWGNKSKSIALLTADRNLLTFEKLGFKKTMNFMEYQKI